jgi:hypothetical protein
VRGAPAGPGPVTRRPGAATLTRLACPGPFARADRARGAAQARARSGATRLTGTCRGSPACGTRAFTISPGSFMGGLRVRRGVRGLHLRHPRSRRMLTATMVHPPGSTVRRATPPGRMLPPLSPFRVRRRVSDEVMRPAGHVVPHAGDARPVSRRSARGGGTCQLDHPRGGNAWFPARGDGDLGELRPG